jgi:hypothetical protein
MTEYRAIADRYLAMWNEPDAVRRRALVAAAWRGDGRYVDPLMAGEGHEAIAALIEGARAQFPGHGFTLRGEPDGHGGHVRFSWTLAPAGGSPVGGGTDIARVGDDGRFIEVVGFLDRSAGG